MVWSLNYISWHAWLIFMSELGVLEKQRSQFKQCLVLEVLVCASPWALGGFINEAELGREEAHHLFMLEVKNVNT